MSHRLKEKFSGYLGLIWEYEHASQLDYQIDCFDIDKIDLGVQTGICELGINFKPLNWPITIDLNGNFRGGKREGLGGSLSIKYEF
jgi:hypothetical protein